MWDDVAGRWKFSVSSPSSQPTNQPSLHLFLSLLTQTSGWGLSFLATATTHAVSGAQDGVVGRTRATSLRLRDSESILDGTFDLLELTARCERRPARSPRSRSRLELHSRRPPPKPGHTLHTHIMHIKQKVNSPRASLRRPGRMMSQKRKFFPRTINQPAFANQPAKSLGPES